MRSLSQLSDLHVDSEVLLNLNSRGAARRPRTCSLFVSPSLLHGSFASLSPTPLTSSVIWRWLTYKTSWGDFTITLIKIYKRKAREFTFVSMPSIAQCAMRVPV